MMMKKMWSDDFNCSQCEMMDVMEHCLYIPISRLVHLGRYVLNGHTFISQITMYFA